MFSYRKLSAKEQLKIDLKGYILAVGLYVLPSLGWDLGLSGRFLTAAVFLGSGPINSLEVSVSG